jgi:hypothetical protein
MTKVMIKAGAEIETTSPAETTDIVGRALHFQVTEQEITRARGIKYVRVSGPGPSPAAGTLYIASGPEVGYIWALRFLSVQLDSADTVLAYVTSSAPTGGATPQRLLASMSTSAANQVTLFATAQAMLYGGESVYLKGAAHNITAFYLGAWEVPSEMEWKLL